MLSILVCDDHPIVRKGLKGLLIEQFKKINIEETEDGCDTLDKIRTRDDNISLLNLSVPNSGFELLKQVKTIKPHTPILVLSMRQEDVYAIRALKAGAAGYLSKGFPLLELTTAINKILKGGKYISPSLAEKIAYEMENDYKGPPHNYLSDREYQVMMMIAQGKQIKDIAKELNLSNKTVSTYRTRILNKIKLDNSAQIMKYAIKNKLVEL